MMIWIQEGFVEEAVEVSDTLFYGKPPCVSVGPILILKLFLFCNVATRSCHQYPFLKAYSVKLFPVYPSYFILFLKMFILIQ